MDKRFRHHTTTPLASPSAGGGAFPLQSRRPTLRPERGVAHVPSILQALNETGRTRLFVLAEVCRLSGADARNRIRALEAEGLVHVEEPTLACGHGRGQARTYVRLTDVGRRWIEDIEPPGGEAS